MSEETLEVTEDLTPSTDTESVTTEQEATPEPVNDDTANSTEEDKPSRAEQRIQQLVGDKKSAMEYGNMHKEQADFYKAQYDAVVASQTPKAEAPKPLTIPTMEDFDHDTEQWATAMLSYNTQIIDQKVNSGVALALEATNKQAAQTAQDANWSANVAKFKEVNPDVDFNTAFATKDIYSIIKGQENGPAIAIYLGQNPAEAQRIGTLPKSQQAFELGKLQMSQVKPAAKQKTTQAPTPPNPVGGQQPNTSTANESIDDFMKRRREQTKAQRRR